VENAVKHGITPKQGLGRITIRASDLGDRLRIEVEDEADGPHHGAPTKGSGVALQTLRKRLQQQYDGHANLQLSSMERGTLVTLELPKHVESTGEQV
jgi:two-component system LytT family sensor kinase